MLLHPVREPLTPARTLGSQDPTAHSSTAIQVPGKLPPRSSLRLLSFSHPASTSKSNFSPTITLKFFCPRTYLHCDRLVCQPIDHQQIHRSIRPGRTTGLAETLLYSPVSVPSSKRPLPLRRVLATRVGRIVEFLLSTCARDLRCLAEQSTIRGPEQIARSAIRRISEPGSLAFYCLRLVADPTAEAAGKTLSFCLFSGSCLSPTTATADRFSRSPSEKDSIPTIHGLVPPEPGVKD